MGRAPGKGQTLESLGTLLETRRNIPSGGRIPAETAELVAVAAARLKALGLAADTLAKRTKVRLTGADPARLLTLASAVYPVSVTVAPARDTPGSLSATARVFNAPRDPEEVVNELLRDPDSLDQQRTAFISYRTTVDKALEVLNAAAEARGSGADEQEAVLAGQLEKLASRLRGLEVYLTLLRLGDIRHAPQNAVEKLTDALKTDGDNPLLWMGLGEALQQQGQAYAALDALNTAVRLQAPARANYMRGLVQLSLHMPALAVDDFSKAVQAEPDRAEWWHALGSAKFLAGDTQGMCSDLYRACAQGFCDGLEDVRKQNYCR